MSEQKPSLVLSVVAAAFPLATVPLGLAFLAALASGSEGTANAWNEGGWAMSTCVLATLVASLGSAVAVFLASRRNVMAIVAVPVLASAVMAIGVFGFRTAMSGSLLAVVHASPSDRGIIMAGATGEATWAVVFPLLLVAALFMLTAGALLFGALARRGHPDAASRGVLGLLALGSLAIGGWALAAATSRAWVGEGFRALAHAEPSDRLFLVVNSLQRRQSERPIEGALLLAVLVMGALAAMLLRSSRTAGAGVMGWLLVTVAGIGGLRALAISPPEVEPLIASALHTEPLHELDGPPTREFRGLILDSGLSTVNDDGTREPLELLDPARLRLREYLPLGLGKNVTALQLAETLRQALTARLTSVALIGVHVTPLPPGVAVPSPFDAAFTSYRAVWLKLAREEERCARECTFATLDGAGVHQGNETWPLADRSEGTEGDSGLGEVLLRWEAFEPSLLIRAAHAVAAQRKQLVLVAPAPPRAERKSSAGGSPVDVTQSGEVMAMGSLAKELILKVIRSNRGQIRSCYESTLARLTNVSGKITVKFVISATGEVATATVNESTVPSDELEKCVIKRLMTWQFPKPKGGGVAIVRYPFTFALE